MSAFTERLGIIPRPAWITGVLLSFALILPLVLGPMRFEPEMRDLPLIAKVGILSAVPAFMLTYSLLVGFVYVDAKRRRMRHVMWAWLAVVPYFIGVILYFILRDPLPTPCPHCGMQVPQAFAYCMGCGASIHPTCSQCGKALQVSWSNCPHCGAPAAPSAAAAKGVGD